MSLTDAQLKALYNKPKKKVVLAGTHTSKLQGRRTIGGKTYFFKSLWEMNYARYLEWLKNNHNILDWEYEPRTFRFPKEAYDAGPFLYKPDFLITIKKNVFEWHEVKGWMSPASKKKIKRFTKHFPKESLILVQADWFKKAFKQGLNKLIPGWESLPK